MDFLNRALPSKFVSTLYRSIARSHLEYDRIVYTVFNKMNVFLKFKCNGDHLDNAVNIYYITII